ncbi:YheC/YheD family protein [Neobacillus mesonae]|uniref:YheC/YheD family endospore coat-associated protein n=1 Tax=Neobacillus mesonae TaxID=1193713 RepID=UPI00257476CE|nr:YheC/YheD family protein [Neobacillus mesonae]
MSLTLIPITVTMRKTANPHDQLMQISKKLLKQLNISDSKNISIEIGKTSIIMNIQPIDIPANEIILPENVMSNFRLPVQNYRFLASFQPESQTLKLGPVVGLLTNFYLKENDEPNFRSVHKFCEELHHVISGNGGFFYVFSYENFLTKGYYFQEEKWISVEPPLPDVIYNRIHSRILEKKISFQEFRQDLELLMIPLFNDRFLSKWEVYDEIHNESPLKKAIPETKIFSMENLIELAQKYETLFIKPIHGSQGKNIIKLIRVNENRFTYRASLTGGHEQPETYYSLEDIYKHLKPILQNRIYIVQQGIPFITKDFRTMDFRVLCHKKHPLMWDITSIVARIGADQEFVSNLARGGTLIRPLDALRTCFDAKQGKKVLSEIKDLALKIAASISSQTHGMFGELGIDIGVDIDGKPWLIEVNSKPSKSFEENQEKIRPSAKAIVRFCTTLVFDLNLEGEVG